MVRLGTLRNKNWGVSNDSDLLDLLSPAEQVVPQTEMLFRLERHVKFLEELGYLTVESQLMGGGFYGVRLTAGGQRFVQPELAEFGNAPLLPRVVESIESQILTYPEQSRGAFLFRLRESISQNSPELIAKLLVEVLPQMLSRTG